MALGRPTFVNKGCGMGYEATMYLTTRGVRVTGTDAWSWDAPFSYTAQKVAETGDTSLIWEGHKGARHRLLPSGKAAQPGGAAAPRLHGQLLPHKIKGASAGWTRAVAIIED
jgi:kynurenine formamidase